MCHSFYTVVCVILYGNMCYFMRYIVMIVSTLYAFTDAYMSCNIFDIIVSYLAYSYILISFCYHFLLSLNFYFHFILIVYFYFISFYFILFYFILLYFICLFQHLPEAVEGLEPVDQPTSVEDRKMWPWWKVKMNIKMRMKTKINKKVFDGKKIDV